MTRRILLGKLPGGSFGLRVSAPGIDVYENPPNNDHLYFSSDWPELFPIYMRGAFNAANNTLTTIGFANLGYVPYVLGAFTADGSVFKDFGSQGNNGTSGSIWTYSNSSPFARLEAFADHLTFISNLGNLTVYYTILTTKAFE